MEPGHYQGAETPVVMPLQHTSLKHLWTKIIFSLVLLLALKVHISNFFIPPSSIFSQEPTAFRNVSSHSTKVNSAQELMAFLKDKGLWELPPDAPVPYVNLAGFPDDLDHFDARAKKRLFLHALLPVAMIACEEVVHERERLVAIVGKLKGGASVLHFGDTSNDLFRDVSPAETAFLGGLARKYRTQDLTELLLRVDQVPISLILGQGAFESSWGASRLAVEDNNLFGMYIWSKSGPVSSQLGPDKHRKVAVYDSILDSVRSYLLNLNRLNFYHDFRRIRQNTKDPIALADGLMFYSVRREEYISELKSLIQANQLDRYDGYSLATMPVYRDNAFAERMLVAVSEQYPSLFKN